MKPLIYFLSTVFFLSSLSTGLAQDEPNLEEFDNRYEGTVSLPVSSLPLLNVVSFTGFYEDFEHHQDQKLTIGFMIDQADTVAIEATETRGEIIYRMQSKPFEIQAGWNEFKPWPVDEVLSKLHLTSQDIGITIHHEKDDKLFYPAFVYHQELEQTLEHYLFQFIPGETLTRVNFQLYKGTFEGNTFEESAKVYSRDFGRREKYGGERFFLGIELEKIELPPDWNGWLTLVMQARDMLTYEKVSTYFSFYHHPR